MLSEGTLMNAERIDSIVFDLKQSIDDLSNELKIMIEEISVLSKQIEDIKKEENKE